MAWTPEGWAPSDLVAGLRGSATPMAPGGLPAAGRVWLTRFRDVHTRCLAESDA
jgi:hypothetical protein